MRKLHGVVYDAEILKHGWKVKLSTSQGNADPKNDTRDVDVPRFTQETFVEHLVRFIVADDQVSLFSCLFN
jgi:hypothetical protein